MLMRLKACVPIYKERFSIFLDLENSKCSPNFVSKFFPKLAEFLKYQMPYSVQNCYVFGDWKDTAYARDFLAFQAYLSKSQMVTFIQLNSGDSNLLSTYIDPDCVELRMGGKMEDLKEFWPPRCYDDATKTLDEHSFIKFGIIPFTFSDLEFQVFES